MHGTMSLKKKNINFARQPGTKATPTLEKLPIHNFVTTRTSVWTL